MDGSLQGAAHIVREIRKLAGPNLHQGMWGCNRWLDLWDARFKKEQKTQENQIPSVTYVKSFQGSSFF
jgi:hypothetical protein